MNSCTPNAVTRAVLLPLLLFGFCTTSSSLRYGDYSGDPSAVYTYDRFPEVERHCAPILPVLAELKPDDTRGEKIKNELWFVNGEWSQEPDAAPLIPIKDDEMDVSGFNSSTKLVSFWVMNVDSNRRSENMVSVNGIMEIGFTSQTHQFSEKPYRWSPEFETGYGVTKLIITFEGVYVESHENGHGGERHMCLLGTSMMPNSEVSSSQVLQNDKIMLILKYPKTFTLTSRVIYGQMQELATTSNVKDFGKVSISSQLNSRGSKYRFGSEQVLKACSPYKDSDIWFHGTSVIFQGKDLCNYLQRISGMTSFIIKPKHVSDVRDGVLGSFVHQNGDFNLGSIRIVLRNFICHPGFYGINTANVSAEFAVTSDQHLLNGPNPRDSTGLFGKSIFAEGIWSSSETELCMVGCLSSPEKDSVMCDYRVSILLPTALNIHRRSAVYGTITSVKAHSESDDKISFENVVSSPSEFLRWADSYVAYDYSKLSLASAFKSRHDQFPSLVSTLQRTVFEYPSYNPNSHGSLSFLAQSLTVPSTSAVYIPKKLDASKPSEEFQVSNVVSVDLLIGSQHVHLSPAADIQAYSEIRTVVLHGYLSITGQWFSNVSLSVEGLYDPTLGTMHLIGCTASPIENTESLEQGQDCMIEIQVEYPPTNVRWFSTQKLKISIISQRENHDVLYFSPVVVQTKSMIYPWQVTEEEFIKTYEQYITLILLFLTWITITHQRKYMIRNQGEASNSYMSLVMIGIQQSTYLISFVTVSDSIISSAGSNVYDYAVASNSSLMQLMLLMTITELFILFRVVRDSRNSRRLSQPNYASDIKVLIITLSIHVLGLSIFLSNYSDAGFGTPVSLPIKELEAYWVLVHDFFLLPQIIANRLRRIKSKPLSKLYYIGFSMIRAFPHLYTYYRDPVSDYVTARKGGQAAATVASSKRFSDLVIAVAVILLAAVVYIQQRCYSDSKAESEPESVGESESLPEVNDCSN